MSDVKPENAGYFAPPSPDVAPLAVAPEPVTWGEDATEIAATAGLGSYGAEVSDQVAREDALIRGLERMDGEIRALRRYVGWLSFVLVAAIASTAWLFLK